MIYGDMFYIRFWFHPSWILLWISHIVRESIMEFYVNGIIHQILVEECRMQLRDLITGNDFAPFLVRLSLGDFLVSIQNHTTDQERELEENVYSNEAYTDTATLLEQPGPSNRSGISFISGIISKSRI